MKRKVIVNDAKLNRCTKVSEALAVHVKNVEARLTDAEELLKKEKDTTTLVLDGAETATAAAAGDEQSMEALKRRLKRECLFQLVVLNEVWIGSRTTMPTNSLKQEAEHDEDPKPAVKSEGIHQEVLSRMGLGPTRQVHFRHGLG